ncbi:hypothetical protein K440DRAFT_241928 [Wilcoxina mikolae CBS 423.85]|nr:hypothetical protein K440DRAFT_241928 [Wilcoxina mikolae CBS 423.85]
MSHIDLRGPVNISDNATPRLVMPRRRKAVVELCHPGYPRLPPILHVMLLLPQVDSITTTTPSVVAHIDLNDAIANLALTDTTTPTPRTYFGIHYNTAATACFFLAANRIGILLPRLLTQSEFSAYVEANPDAVNPPLDLDQLFSEPRYYFYPLDWDTDDTPDYPVCPDFRRWGFPHEHFASLVAWNLTGDDDSDAEVGNVEPIIATSAVSQFVKERDRRCKISDYADGLESAHTVPKEEANWYCANSMSAYASNKQISDSNPTTDIDNLLALRKDLHSAFDKRVFVFVPKANSGVFYVHFLARTPDFCPIYHNREVAALSSVISPQFLFARFAWAIFPFAKAFIKRSGIRITTWNTVSGKWEAQQSVDGLQWFNQLAQGRVKSRQRTEEDKGGDKPHGPDAAGERTRDLEDSAYHSPPNSQALLYAASIPTPTNGIISPEALSEIIRLSCAHPTAMSHLSAHHPLELAAAVTQFEKLRKLNIAMRMSLL